MLDRHWVVHVLIPEILHCRRQVSEEDWIETAMSYSRTVERRGILTDVLFSNFFCDLDIGPVCECTL